MRDPLVISLQKPASIPPRKRSLWPLVVLVIIGVSAIIIGAGYFVYSKFSPTPEGEDIQELVGDVGLLMLLPSDEQPTVASVTSLDALKDQPFFKNAKIGDMVLMYPKAGRAILYSPSENMIIEVAPIVLDAQ